MASQQDIKRRIRSVRSTYKITKAMELVSAAKLRRSQQRIVAMRPYADRMLELITSTAQTLGKIHGLPLLEDRETHTVALLPLCQRLEQADPLGHSRQRVVNSKLAEQLANLAPG